MFPGCPVCVPASLTDSEVTENQTCFNLYSVRALWLIHLSQTPGTTLLSQHNPSPLVPHKCVMQGTFRVRKALLMKGVWHLLTFFILLSTPVVLAATVRQVAEQRA